MGLLPSVSPITAKKGRAHDLPAAGIWKSASWKTWSVSPFPPGRTSVDVPGEGTPLMGDWDGDRVKTPGRYVPSLGLWFTSNARVGEATMTQVATPWGGLPTDIPVVGDINNDGKDDTGIFRDGEWFWRTLDGVPIPQFHYGAAKDIPVVGDWNGDGITDVGVVRKGTWYLNIIAAKKSPGGLDSRIKTTADKKTSTYSLKFKYGKKKDTPVAGDWDGDGTTEIGAVRGKRMWYLNDGLSSLSSNKHLDQPLDSGYVPLVANSLVTDPNSCPTASPSAEAKAIALGTTVKKPQLLGADEAVTGFQDVAYAARDLARYIIVSDVKHRLNDRTNQPYYDALSTSGKTEWAIRRGANAAQAVSLMLTTSPWDESNNISREMALSYVKWQVRSIACQHSSITRYGWGNLWQSALWAAVTGQAAWMIWDDLTPQEKGYVASMVASEADFVSARGPRYWKNRAGEELTPGNSRADEVAWDLLAPALAIAMMPQDSRVPTWRASLASHAIAAFARPADLTSGQVVNGINVSEALGGTNANDDGTVVNHDKLNPDYIQNVENLWWAVSILRSAGQSVPAALFFNSNTVYGAFSQRNFEVPPFLDPGGFIYKEDGSIYYPAGVDWGSRRPATYVGVDAFAALYADAGLGGEKWLALHAANVRQMQARWTDGHLYTDDQVEESYKGGREEYAAHQIALAWWAMAATLAPLNIDSGPISGINLARSKWRSTPEQGGKS